MSRIKHLGRRRGQERVVFETELEPLNVILSIKPACRVAAGVNDIDMRLGGTTVRTGAAKQSNNTRRSILGICPPKEVSSAT